jgi:hypothetical protein
MGLRTFSAVIRRFKRRIQYACRRREGKTVAARISDHPGYWAARSGRAATTESQIDADFASIDPAFGLDLTVAHA